MTDRVKTDMRFAMIPEWLLDLEDLSHAAIRLYCVLDRYADADGRSFPSRKALAERLGVKSADTVDRALKELIEAHAVTVTRRYDDAGDPTSNLYVVHRYPPEGVAARMRPPTRTSAATGPQDSGEGSRTVAALNENHLKEEPPFPPQAGEPPTSTRTCPKHGTTLGTNCRGCGTTNRQILAAEKRATAEARRLAEQQRLAEERQRLEERIVPSSAPAARALLEETRKNLANRRAG